MYATGQVASTPITIAGMAPLHPSSGVKSMSGTGPITSQKSIKSILKKKSVSQVSGDSKESQGSHEKPTSAARGHDSTSRERI